MATETSRRSQRFPLLIGVGAFRTLAVPSACLLFVGALAQTLYLEGPDLPNGDLWRKVGYLGPVLAVVVCVSPIALFFTIGAVVRILRNAIATRACDVWLDEEGMRIAGGRAGGFAASWKALRSGRVTWSDSQGLSVIVSGRTLTVPVPRDAREAASLRAVAETVIATSLGDQARGTERREPPGVIHCSECAAPLAPAAEAVVRCGFCQTENELPETLVERVRGLARLVGERRRDERALHALSRQPGAWLANVIAFFGGVTILCLGVMTVLYTAGLAFVDGMEAGMPRLPGVGLVGMGLCLGLFAAVVWLLATRRALRMLTLGFGAVAPARPGEPFACRECAGPLPEPPNDASLIDCAYCQTSNVRAVDARLHVAVLNIVGGAESTPHDILASATRRRRSAAVLGLCAVALVAGGAHWWTSARNIEIDRARAVVVPFVDERSPTELVPVEPGPGAERIDRVARFGGARVTLLPRGGSDLDIIAVDDTGTHIQRLGEVGQPWFSSPARAHRWTRHQGDILTLTGTGVSAVAADGLRESYPATMFEDPIVADIAGGPSRLFITTRASRHGHFRVRELRDGQAPVVNEDIRELAFHPDGSPVAAVILVDDRFQLALLDDVDSGHAVLLTRGAGHARCPAFSPDGEHLAFLTESVRDSMQYSERNGETNLWTVSTTSGDLVQLTTGRDLTWTCPAWIDDGIYVLAFEQPDPTSAFEQTLLRVVLRK